MTQSIKKELLFKTTEGNPVYKFRIPNNTGDYVDVTNCGASISGIFVHRPDMSMEDLAGKSSSSSLTGVNTLPILGGSLGEVLSNTAWSVMEEGENHVLFAQELDGADSPFGVSVKVGLRITWVNLNRLIVDIFVTPAEAAAVHIEGNISIDSSGKAFSICTFCPFLADSSGNEKPVAKSVYKDMAFAPVDCETPIFLNHSEEIKPMIELADDKSLLRLSVYSTFDSASCSKDEAASCVNIKACSSGEEQLKKGQTLTHRIILGIDYIQPVTEDDEVDPAPLSCFL